MIFEGLTKVRTDLESTLKDVRMFSKGFWLCILFREKLQIMFLFSYLFMAWVLRVFLFGWKTCVMIEVYLSKTLHVLFIVIFCFNSYKLAKRVKKKRTCDMAGHFYFYFFRCNVIFYFNSNKPNSNLPR